jgi:nucleotide-binding universal stress UspA family protein
MAPTYLLCADGSDLSTRALQAGLAVVRPDAHVIIATVVPLPDPTLVTGTGMAGGTITPTEYESQERAELAHADVILSQAAEALGLDAPEPVVLRGAPGPALCDLAASRDVDAVVIGTHGRGGITRALLGSVSDHVVRRAPCPVIVVGDLDARRADHT